MFCAFCIYFWSSLCSSDPAAFIRKYFLSRFLFTDMMMKFIHYCISHKNSPERICRHCPGKDISLFDYSRHWLELLLYGFYCAALNPAVANEDEHKVNATDLAGNYASRNAMITLFDRTDQIKRLVICTNEEFSVFFGPGGELSE